MARTELPFADDGHDSVYAALPKPLREVCAENRFLADYLRRVPMGELGPPDYCPKLSRQIGERKVRNLIYPIKGGLFVHIYPDLTSERDHYISIEPHLTVNLDDVVPKVERKLLDWTEEIGGAETDEEKEEKLLKAIDAIVSTDGVGKISVTPRGMEALKYLFLRNKIGTGPLTPLLQDPYIEDISCSGVGPIFIEHKIFKSLQASLTFPTDEELDEFVIWLGELIKKPVTVRHPIVDAILPDGSRLNIVYGTDISKRGSNFTIRKFSETPLSVMELIEFGTLDYTIAAYLSLVLEAGMNLFVVGATASGKTTMMNAITTFIPPDKKIVSIEDTPELQVPHKNWIREVTRGREGEKKGSEVGMFALLKAALRQRPDLIVIGEIRGEEGAIAFQAMQTGHAVISTFHADSVGKCIQRLTGDPINIPKTYVDILDVIVIQATTKTADGRTVRRILSVNEIMGYDPIAQTFSVIEVFHWNPARDTFDFPGYMSSYLLEEKVALKQGIPSFKRKAIYTKLKRRARILQRIHRGKKTRGFYEVFQILAEAYRQNLL